MLNLPPTENRPAKPQPSLAGYGAVYALWLLIIVASLLVILAIRDLYQMAMVLTTWHRYTVHAVNQFATLGLILILVVVVVAVEGYFRNGLKKGQLTYRFWYVFAIISATLAAVLGIRVALEALASNVNPISVLGFVLVAGIAWGARRAAARVSPRRHKPQAVKPSGDLNRSS